MTTLTFSNGVMIDSAQIVRVESNQQTIQFPDEIGEFEHMLHGRPSTLVIRLRDGSDVAINAGHTRLKIHMEETRPNA